MKIQFQIKYQKLKSTGIRNTKKYLLKLVRPFIAILKKIIKKINFIIYKIYIKKAKNIKYFKFKKC